jgi:transcriptional regulator with XRE-family HTH domain
MATIYQAVGNRIRELRGERGWSQEEFADRCRIHRSHMGEIERGEVDASISTLRKVAKGFGMTVSEFLRGVV